MKLLLDDRNYHYCASMFLGTDYKDMSNSKLHRGSFENEVFEKRITAYYNLHLYGIKREEEYITIFDELIMCDPLEINMLSITL